jgi:TPP-dependent pyruvate/acetoin dehydrogenase alpha subunit
MAIAAKMKKSDEVFMLYHGDGATSKGDFQAGYISQPIPDET